MNTARHIQQSSISSTSTTDDAWLQGVANLHSVVLNYDAETVSTDYVETDRSSQT